ncbi:MAG: lipid-binding SYLF domain-containing protein [Polyangiales bacterium]
MRRGKNMNKVNSVRPSRAALALGVGLVSLAPLFGACASEPKTAADLQKKNDEQQARLEESSQLITKLRTQIPDQVASRAKCILVVPGYSKGGVIVGGEGGKGFATCISGGTWSAPAPIKVGGGSVGAQIGYESSDVLALIVSDKAAKSLEAGKFEIGTSASAAAGPVGTGSPTDDLGAKGEVLTYSHSKGLFAGVSLNGATVSSDEGATRAMYGNGVDLASVLERRSTPAQSGSVQSFLRTVNTAFAPSANDTAVPHTSP